MPYIPAELYGCVLSSLILDHISLHLIKKLLALSALPDLNFKVK